MRLCGRRDEEGLRVFSLEDERLRLRHLEAGLRKAPERSPGQATSAKRSHRPAQGLQEQGREAVLRSVEAGWGSQGAAGVRPALAALLDRGCDIRPEGYAAARSDQNGRSPRGRDYA